MVKEKNPQKEKKPETNQWKDGLGIIIDTHVHSIGALDSYNVKDASNQIALTLINLGEMHKTIDEQFKKYSGTNKSPTTKDIQTVFEHAQITKNQNDTKNNFSRILKLYNEDIDKAVDEYKKGDYTPLYTIPGRLAVIKHNIDTAKYSLSVLLKEDLDDKVNGSIGYINRIIEQQVTELEAGFIKNKDPKNTYLDNLKALDSVVENMRMNLGVQPIARHYIEKAVNVFVDYHSIVPLGLLSMAETHPKLESDHIYAIDRSNEDFRKILEKVSSFGFDMSTKHNRMQKKYDEIKDQYRMQNKKN